MKTPDRTPRSFAAWVEALSSQGRYQRRKGRDLFDLWLGLTEGRADPQRIVECFRRCMAHTGQTVTRREFETNLADKRDHPGFSADLRDLLPVGTGYDFESGFTVVQQELIARL